MSKKRFDPTDIGEMVDELDQSGFFRQPAPSAKSQETSFPGNQQTRNLVNKEPVKQVSQETSKRTTYPKVTYQLSPTVINLLQDTKIALQRQYDVKVSLVEVVEEAIQYVCTDLQENKETSFLVSLFTRKQENK